MFKVSEKPKKNENCAVKNSKDRLSRGDGKWKMEGFSDWVR